MEEIQDNVAKIGVSITLIEFIVCLFLSKSLFSMWALINTLQFMIYIGKWMIVYPDVIDIVLSELSRITQNEFVDDYDIGRKFMELLQIETEEP